MSLFKWLIGDITIKTCGDKIGYLFNNSLFNVSTSGIGVAFTGANCARSFFKGVASPMPWCKGLYFTSAALNGVSCATSSICLLSGYSCIAPLPVLAGTIAYGTSVGARACNSLADCMDPAVLTSKEVDTCIDLATKTWR
jgi:hypothetical protein